MDDLGEIIDLKRVIEKQCELQEETNTLLRALIQTLRENSQAIADASDS